MPIEFRCSQCGKLLRTGDDTAGRQAQCPECGAISQVPGDCPNFRGHRPGTDAQRWSAMVGENGTVPFAPPPLAPLSAATSTPPGSAPGSPFTPGPQFGGETASDNPYQSPGYYGVLTGPADPFAAQRVSGPATALIVTAILCLIFQVLGLLFNLLTIAVFDAGPNGAREPEVFPMMFSVGANVAMGVFGLAISALVLIGAMKMKRLENYTFAMTSAIIAMIPCVSPCCLLGLPFGIWALVVLNDSSVKAAFRS